MTLHLCRTEMELLPKISIFCSEYRAMHRIFH